MSLNDPTHSALDGAKRELGERLSRRPPSIPSKYFYDDRGSALFDAICDLPEYYLTRTERALLDERSPEIADITRARELVELGAGTARKTGHLIESLMDLGHGLHYTPLDISPYALEQAESSLGRAYPDLRITGIQCDYTRSLEELEPDPGCLTVFLGSTIGNFTVEAGAALLRRLRDRLSPGDWFLLGVDLVKENRILEAAYNDSRGITAEFNKNILNVVNRRAEGNFDLSAFDHLAFFDEEKSQIEMHLVARVASRVRLEALDLDLAFAVGERIQTEVSRKFTRESAHELLEAAGFEPRYWFTSDDAYFGLALAAVPKAPDP